MLAVVLVKSVCCCCCCSHPLHHPAVVVCYVFPLVSLTCQLFRSTIIVLQLGLWPGLVFVPLESLYTGKHILSQNTQYSILRVRKRQCETPIINVNTTTRRRRRRRSFASTTTTTTSASSPPPGLALPASRHHQHVHCRRRRRRHDRRRTPAVNSRISRRIRGKTTERPEIQSNLQERFGFTPRVTDDSPDDGVLAPTRAVPSIVLTDRPIWPELLRYSRYS